MPIGRFSKSCRLTIKALRHYDEVGLLKPSFVDPDSGYRYYIPSQAREAVMIGMLRSLEIPIPTIKKLISADGADFQKILQQEQERIKKDLEKKQRTLTSLKRIAQQAQIIPYNITIRDEPNYTVAKMNCVTVTDRMLEDSTKLVYSLYEELQRFGRNFENPVMCINEDPDKHENIVVHACIGVTEPYPALNNAQIAEIPGGPAAWLSHHGPYDELGLAYHSLFAWIQEHGYEQRDAMREIYKNDPSDTAPNELVTEVILPIKLK
ncbi:MAG: MerR family transcriptional regulator [Gammaproteobacteria bacterium]|jgi:DNA-binding transcriptional MerR regulator